MSQRPDDDEIEDIDLDQDEQADSDRALRELASNPAFKNPWLPGREPPRERETFTGQ